MSASPTARGRALSNVLDEIRQSLQTELNHTKIERDAFEAFRTRIADLESVRQPFAANCMHDECQSGSGTAALRSLPVSLPRVTDELQAIRDAYEATVMDIPFYDTEYGDTYEDSIRAEFGPDLAAALTQVDSLCPGVKQALLGKIEQARREREALIETCKTERESVESMASVLNPVNEDLQSIAAVSYHDQGFGQLAAYRTRLLTLKNRCEAAATDRQATIHQHRRTYLEGIDPPHICLYLYDDFEETHPMLALCSDLARQIDDCRRDLERAISASP